MSYIKIILRSLTLSLLAVLPANAAITSASALPSPQLVSLDRASAISVTWNVFTTTGSFVSSSQGRFRTADGAFTFGTINSPLMKNVNPNSLVTLSETVLIPASVVQAVQHRGYSALVYQRAFIDSDAQGMAMDGNMELRITSDAAAGFSVSRLALSFDDGTSVLLLAGKESVHAQAELSFTGSGLLSAVWEVAEPATMLGEPVFRTLQVIRQPLLGASPVRLMSPLLPTHASGPYQMRLRITEPAPGFDPPVIRYFVGEANAPVQELFLYAPNHGDLLATDTRFQWAAAKNAKSYMLLLFALPHSAQSELPELGEPSAGPSQADIAAARLQLPAGGLLVPGDKTSTTLSAATMARLKGGTAYLWQVLAVGEDGSVIGESQLRRIQMP